MKYAKQVTDGDLLESDEWFGKHGAYGVSFYLTGPLDMNTLENLRYGYQLKVEHTSTTRDGFSSIVDAENHALTVMGQHDSMTSHMASPF